MIAFVSHVAKCRRWLFRPRCPIHFRARGGAHPRTRTRATRMRVTCALAEIAIFLCWGLDDVLSQKVFWGLRMNPLPHKGGECSVYRPVQTDTRSATGNLLMRSTATKQPRIILPGEVSRQFEQIEILRLGQNRFILSAGSRVAVSETLHRFLKYLTVPATLSPVRLLEPDSKDRFSLAWKR